MRKALLSISCFTLFCLVIGSTLGAGQTSSALKLNAYVGDSLVYKITTHLNGLNQTVDYMRIQIDSITDYGGYVTVYGRQWGCSEEAFKNSSQALNISTNLISSKLQVAYLLNDPTNDLIVQFNWVWKKDDSVGNYLNQLGEYVDNSVSTAAYSFSKYGNVVKSIAESGNGYEIKITNDTTTLESRKRVYSNTGFLIQYEEFSIILGKFTIEISPDDSTGLISLENLPLTIGVTYAVVLGIGITIGAIVTKMVEKKRPKLAADA